MILIIQCRFWIEDYLPKFTYKSQLTRASKIPNPFHMAPNPCTLGDIFKDYRGRRTALIRALTKDVDKFYELCDPDEGDLCLYGLPNGTWEVSPPVQVLPAHLPEPVVGINLFRDNTTRTEWFSMVSQYCDLWLLSMAFYLGARAHLNSTERECLFNMINDLPTVCDVVTNKKPVKDKSTVASGSKSRRTTKHTEKIKKIENKRVKFYKLFLHVIAQLVKASGVYKTKTLQRSSDRRGKSIPKFEDEDDEKICGSCGENYNVNEFWICCDTCNRWFHEKCVTITPQMAEIIDKYTFSSDNLCIYGHPNETWEVIHPEKLVPAELPKPVQINLFRDGMKCRDWFSLVTVYSDSWLPSVALYIGVRHTTMKVKASGVCKTKILQRSSDGKSIPKFADEDEDDERLCGSCGGNYSVYEFWICCNTCDRWFHGKYVKITPQMAESIDQYKCPSCSMRKGKPYTEMYKFM
ncbi:PHD finger protein ALFIN-LIKE 3, partial [Mucuna pruriens]